MGKKSRSGREKQSSLEKAHPFCPDLADQPSIGEGCLFYASKETLMLD